MHYMETILKTCAWWEEFINIQSNRKSQISITDATEKKKLLSNLCITFQYTKLLYFSLEAWKQCFIHFVMLSKSRSHTKQVKHINVACRPCVHTEHTKLNILLDDNLTMTFNGKKCTIAGLFNPYPTNVENRVSW